MRHHKASSVLGVVSRSLFGFVGLPLCSEVSNSQIKTNLCIYNIPKITSMFASLKLEMDTSSQSRAGGGLWNNARAKQYSKETQDMLRGEMMHFLIWRGGCLGISGTYTEELTVCMFVDCAVYFHFNFLSVCSVMMQESRLTTLQRKQINESLKSKFGAFGWGVELLYSSIVINVVHHISQHSAYNILLK